jgi:hypothetical protein
MGARESRRGRSVALGITAVAALLALASTARAGDGAQFDRSCTSTYVNKKVGDNEQWAITWSIYGDVTGNVLKLDGSPPSFLECEAVGEDGDDELFDCFGASACTAPPCGDTQWTPIGTDIAIPFSFFLPSGVDPLDPFDACVPTA